MIYNITGLLGTGKTLLSVILGNIDFVKDNVEVKSNFYTSFSSKINPLEIAQFELENCTVLLDEAHTIFDSRNSSSPLNRLFSYFFLQSRKRKVNVYLTAQFQHLVERRIRDICDYTIFARQDKTTKDFYYLVTSYGEPITTYRLRYENAEKYFSMYDTTEVIIPITIDKKSIDFKDLMIDFKACSTKRSFIALIKKTYIHLDLESIGACYDFLKKEDMERAKRVLFGNIAQDVYSHN